ncbi:MAG: type II toxin-antitoxin system RelE/ParE family toxin [Candidatus Eremiobacteraeota bacterium]|nr:type II toxin-antitoxin system RelE/ParE family toxin [Candidatus Eremiobacteraeota bacterium]
MILSFRTKETRKIFDGEASRKIPGEIQALARRKLRMLNNSSTLKDLMVPPSNCLEPLSKERKGQYSIRINEQWRICFQWADGHASLVEIVDYH